MTQTARVLAALRFRGARGIDATDFLLPDVIDGGKPITRVAARILDLRQDGHEIIVEGERHGCAVYRLLRDTQDAPAPPPEPPATDGQLFTPQPANAIYGSEAA